MSRDGETSPRLGEEFRYRASALLKNLGYSERINRKFGLDLGADPPPKQRNLARPLFSPIGRTAFDFKSGIRVQILSEANKLNEKIQTLNTSKNPEFSDISGGVILTDNKVGQTDIAKALDLRVNCWDIRYAHFLAKKVEVFRKLVRTNQIQKEEQLDEWTTIFRSFGSYPDFIQMNASLFFHNPLHEMNAEKVESILYKFADNSQTLTDLNIPIIIHLKLHSIAEVTEGAEDKFKELTSQKDGILRYESQACLLTSYSIAPWFINCIETI